MKKSEIAAVPDAPKVTRLPMDEVYPLYVLSLKGRIAGSEFQRARDVVLRLEQDVTRLTDEYTAKFRALCKAHGLSEECTIDFETGEVK